MGGQGIWCNVKANSALWSQANAWAANGVTAEAPPCRFRWAAERLSLRFPWHGSRQCQMEPFGWKAAAAPPCSSLPFTWRSKHISWVEAAHALATLVEARKLSTSQEILLWMTPSEAPKALQTSECSELLDPMRASCWIFAQH